MRIGLARLAVFAACLVFASAAAAQTYPTRQIRFVVPFAAGGPADLLARVIADELSKDLGQQVFVDNRPGANTIIGAEFVAKADPDGYTLLMAIDGTLVMNPYLYSKLSYDPFKDFAPVTLVAQVPSVLEANIDVKANTVADIIATEKAKPGTYLMGYSTPTSQVTAELFNMRAGVKIQLVPYRGGTTQVTGLLGGEISLGLESVNVALPFARAGKLKIIALTGGNRISLRRTFRPSAKRCLASTSASGRASWRRRRRRPQSSPNCTTRSSPCSAARRCATSSLRPASSPRPANRRKISPPSSVRRPTCGRG